MIAVVRNNNYTKELLQLGASNVINTSEVRLPNAVMELTNGFGVTSAIDSIGGADGTRQAFCVQPNGVLLTIGLLSGTPINWMEISQKTKVKVKMFHLRHWNQKVSAQIWQEKFDHLIKLIEKKKIRLMTAGSCFDLLNVKEAIHFAESRKVNKGKILLTS